MAQTKDLIVTSTSSNGTKTFIRIGDETPTTAGTTGSSIQFLQDLSSKDKCFDTAGTSSAFRIRHDTVNGALIFQGRTGSSGIRSLIQFQDQGTVKFTAPVTFEAIGFDDVFAGQITSSHLYIGTKSTLRGTTSVQKLQFTSSTGTASLWYDGTQLQIQGFKSGNSWKTQYKLTEPISLNTTYSIYTTSVQQEIQHYDYLSVYLNDTILLQSKSGISDWDYRKDGNKLNKIIFRYNIPIVDPDDFYLTYQYNGGAK